MYLARRQSLRASLSPPLGAYRRSFLDSNGPLLILARSASKSLSSSEKRLRSSRSGRGKTEAMFQRAANKYPAAAATTAPLQTTLAARSNGGPLSTPLQKSGLATAASSLGVKRKIEMTASTQSALGSLHNEVYFDENDFDDDEDLDFEAPDPLITRPSIVPSATTHITKPPIVAKQQHQQPPQKKEEETAGYPNLSSAFADEKIPIVDLTETPARDSSTVKYPDLPPVPDNDQQPPSSSIQYPWSSSPPSHYQAPTKKPRKLPWLEEEEDGLDFPKSKTLATPARQKQTPIWNKSASAIKDEQRELRRQSKSMKALMAGQFEPPRAQVASIFLSDEQRHVLDAVVQQGKSIFFTGSAGTGKSVLMREIIKKLRDKYKREPDRVAVTASTGLAACNIGGVTLHSFAGIGLGKDPVPELVKKIKRNPKARTRWLRTRVLIIDEVSMVDGDLFDKLEELARRLRNNGRPFGGIQLVVTGDFFQLPPVPESGQREAKFSFDASTWNTSIQHTILLTHVFRQKDPEFANMLNEMRLGRLTRRTIETFKQLSRPLDFHDSIEATELFPTRLEVEGANNSRMARLSGEVMRFAACDSGTIQDPQFRDKLLANCMAPQVIHLKKGAQVMLIKNMEDQLVNGSIGRVVAFMDESTFDYYRENENEFSSNGGAATTSNNNKGGEEGFGSDGDDAAAAQARARKKLKPLVNKDGTPGPPPRKWPLVCFVQPDGTERHLLCQPETWKIELPNGEVQAQRQQVPLILAWALSIHKAQGQTLQRVKVDLGKVFEKGQAYVALSRATSKAGLQVTGFEARKVMVHPKVIDFYSKLVSITDVLKPKAGKTAVAATTTEDEPEDDFDQAFRSVERAAGYS